MRPGSGKIQRAVLAAFEAETDNAFTSQELIERAYPGLGRIEKKHRVAMSRAAKKLCMPETGLAWLRGGGLGGRLVFFNRYNVLSYATGRLKADPRNDYQSNDPRCTGGCTEVELRKEISPGGRCHRHVVPGGVWWRQVRLWTAQRDGEAEAAQQLEAELDGEGAALKAGQVTMSERAARVG
ncbi:hypothetical protein [Methylobacterium oxalidis]|uniref:Uncharacterized protein n=1 Tax=Methylobacterium oxalidis TaxID=944322 RepID=A0A512J9K6_9HYPH|nr:hypothetical protein [Methylobacterium oxalidis]GEP06632.1 hypothetical protein MOX02_46700 [Methylobacterium oxalidis]GJE35390.1 hypothetical protein LDDCCGHA_5608 [Methylobacterium oxalidis]GLS66246.1 hypothetical protein GCM10007888_46280 [Methylobacterium oxalidis]